MHCIEASLLLRQHMLSCRLANASR